MDYNFRVTETKKEKVLNEDLIPVESGRYLICVDTGDTYYDTADGIRKHLVNEADGAYAIEFLAESGVLVPVYQNGVFYTAPTGQIYVL